VKRHINIFLAGVMIVAPFAVTAYVLWWLAAAMDLAVWKLVDVQAGQAGVKRPVWLFPGAGVVALLVGVYIVGLLTKLWFFRIIVNALERAMLRVPVIKGVFETIRDILKLFGGDPKNMGQVVLCKLPGTDVKMLGILTNRTPRATAGQQRVAVWLPMGYQLGGYTLYLPPDAVEPISLTVQEAMRIAATAEAGAQTAAGAVPKEPETPR
jgi:uncharacterized membrane protein